MHFHSRGDRSTPLLAPARFDAQAGECPGAAAPLLVRTQASPPACCPPMAESFARFGHWFHSARHVHAGLRHARRAAASRVHTVRYATNGAGLANDCPPPLPTGREAARLRHAGASDELRPAHAPGERTYTRLPGAGTGAGLPRILTLRTQRMRSWACFVPDLAWAFVSKRPQAVCSRSGWGESSPAPRAPVRSSTTAELSRLKGQIYPPSASRPENRRPKFALVSYAVQPRRSPAAD